MEVTLGRGGEIDPEGHVWDGRCSENRHINLELSLRDDICRRWDACHSLVWKIYKVWPEYRHSEEILVIKTVKACIYAVKRWQGLIMLVISIWYKLRLILREKCEMEDSVQKDLLTWSYAWGLTYVGGETHALHWFEKFTKFDQCTDTVKKTW